MRTLSLAAGAVIAMALCGAAAAAEDAASCTGPFGPDSSEARLIEAFGKANVVTGEVDGPEGSTMLATTVFPDDPAKKLQFTWWDEESFSLVANVALPPGMAGPGGLMTGMTIGEVQALNGEPFELTGFYWDYGGYAGFQSGKLSDLPGGCMLSLSFEPKAAELTDKQSEEVSGDQQLSSDLPVLATIDTRLVGINFGYPAPEGMFDDMGEPVDEDEPAN